MQRSGQNNNQMQGNFAGGQIPSGFTNNFNNAEYHQQENLTQFQQNRIQPYQGENNQFLKQEDIQRLPVQNPQQNDLNIDSALYPQLQNVVSTVNLNCTLDLKQIALQCRNAEYNPKRFAAVIMRLRDPKTTALIFQSGKIVCTGARSQEQSKTAAKKYARIIQKAGFQNVKFSSFTVQNMVGSCDVKFPIKLDMLQSKDTGHCQYEPELFPGLIYRMAQPKVVLLIFVSGKLVLTGAKKKEDIDLAFQRIYPVLKQCQKSDKQKQPQQQNKQ